MRIAVPITLIEYSAGLISAHSSMHFPVQIVMVLLIFAPFIFRAEHANDPDPGQHL